MLKITFEIVPGGDPVHPQRREIGHLNIGLQSKHSNFGQYLSMLTTDGLNDPSARVVQVAHDRRDGPFELAKICLEAHLRDLKYTLPPTNEFVTRAEALLEFDREDPRR